MLPLVLKGFLLGWSVAWPPGPINAEMIRRGLTRGFWSAWAVGLGACAGDFGWALAVALGAGALLDRLPGLRPVLGVVSIALLLFLAWTFGRGAWQVWRARHEAPAAAKDLPRSRLDSSRGGFLLGLTMALSSPWNIAFWLAVIGSQANEVQPLGLGSSLVLALAVLAGALTWGFLLCSTVQLGARVFARPGWLALTQGATAALMLAFAARVVARLVAG